jgi:endoglucanase
VKSTPRRILRRILIPVLSTCVILAILGLVLPRLGLGHLTLPLARKEQFSVPNAESFPSRLHASEHQIVDNNGKAVLLKGLMPPDSATLASEVEFDRAFFEGMAETGANVIRTPVHADNWVNDEYYLWRYLDPVVTWAGEMGMYVIVDWHSIGNVVTGAGAQMPDTRENSMDLALSFWSTTARYFRDAPNVIFEIFNEPESISPQEWKGGAEKLIQTIRAEGADQLVIVGGTDFGRDLSWVLKSPISDANVAYAAHIYPIHASSGWDGWFGDVAEKYPVISTEWGFMDKSESSASSYLVGKRTGYGEPFLKYLTDRGIGWVACWYDDEWLPPMFEEGQKQLTDYGKFVLENL